jgi:hypothetical protein
MPPTAVLAPPVSDTLFDRESFERAWRGVPDGDRITRTPAAGAQLTLRRDAPWDIPDRRIDIWVDGEAWGRIAAGRPLTREISAGLHCIRASNTLFKATLEFSARPGEHVWVQCSNRIPPGGWLMMAFIHVAYLRVRLERVVPRPEAGSGGA